MQVIAHEPIESYARQRTSCALVRHLGDFVRSDLGLGIAPKSTVSISINFYPVLSMYILASDPK